MKMKKSEMSAAKAAFRDAVASLYPVARGSLALLSKPDGMNGFRAFRGGNTSRREKLTDYDFMSYRRHFLG